MSELNELLDQFTIPNVRFINKAILKDIQNGKFGEEMNEDVEKQDEKVGVLQMSDRAVSTLFKKVNDLQVEWNERIEELRSSQQLKLEELSRRIAEAPTAKTEEAEAGPSAEVAPEEDVEIPSEDVEIPSEDARETENETEEHTMAASNAEEEVVEPQPQTQQMYTGYSLAYECKLPPKPLKTGGQPKKTLPNDPESLPGLLILFIICIAVLVFAFIVVEVDTHQLNKDVKQLKANVENITTEVETKLAEERQLARDIFHSNFETTALLVRQLVNDMLSADQKNKAERIIASMINEQKMEKVKSTLKSWNITATDIEQLMKEIEASVSPAHPDIVKMFTGLTMCATLGIFILKLWDKRGD